MAIRTVDDRLEYVGEVLRVREMNGYDDSDWYALVFPASEDRPREVQCGSTRCAWPVSADVDATLEVRARFDAWRSSQIAAEREREAYRAAAEVTKGKRVVVVSGRKHKGKTGECFWRGANQFRTYYRNGYNQPDSVANQRVGILTDSGEKFYTDLKQVRVVGYEDADPYQISAERKVGLYVTF